MEKGPGKQKGKGGLEQGHKGKKGKLQGPEKGKGGLEQGQKGQQQGLGKGKGGLEQCQKGKQQGLGKGKGGLDKGQSKGGMETGGLEKGHGKGGLEQGQKGKQQGLGKGKGGLEQGQKGQQQGLGKGKGGLDKGQSKGGMETGGLEKGHGKGGLEQSQLKEIHHAKIQQERDDGFDPSLQESRGRRSRWARQERRKADQAVQERREQFETSGQWPETKPAVLPEEGSQRYRAWQLLAGEVSLEEQTLLEQQEAWKKATEEKLEQRKEFERLQHKLAGDKASGSQGP